MFVQRRRPRFDEEQLREAITASRSWAETLRRLGYRTAGGNWRTLKKYAALWTISTKHFDPDAVCAETLRRTSTPRPLDEILVEHSTYSREHLKRRLFAEGRRRSIPTVPARTGFLWSPEIVCIAARNSCRATGSSATAPGNVALGGTGTGGFAGYRSRTRVGSSGRPTSSSGTRSKGRVTSPLGASTAYPTTRFANGSGGTSARRSGSAWRADLQTALSSRCRTRRWGFRALRFRR